MQAAQDRRLRQRQYALVRQPRAAERLRQWHGENWWNADCGAESACAEVGLQRQRLRAGGLRLVVTACLREGRCQQHVGQAEFGFDLDGESRRRQGVAARLRARDVGDAAGRRHLPSARTLVRYLRRRQLAEDREADLQPGSSLRARAAVHRSGRPDGESRRGAQLHGGLTRASQRRRIVYGDIPSRAAGSGLRPYREDRAIASD